MPGRGAEKPFDALGRVTSGSVAAVATFALIHGGGGSAWDWHLVVPALRERGHDAVAVDLPSEDSSAGWDDYADTVVRAIDARRGDDPVSGRAVLGLVGERPLQRERAGRHLLSRRPSGARHEGETAGPRR